MRKQNSSNSINEDFLSQHCTLNTAVNFIAGKWKCQIISSIYKGNNRFTLLKKELPNLSDQVLGRQLRELERDCIIHREDMEGAVPPRIEYCLTEKGKELVPILQNLCKWAKSYQKVDALSPRQKVPAIHQV